MATKDYTLAEIKELIREQANNIKGLSSSFLSSDSDAAYDEAVRECGFELPGTTDADKQLKYHWLILRMRRWYMWQLWQQYILRFKAGDMEAQQIVKNLQNIVDKMDKAFETGKTAEDAAHLFIDSDVVFGTSMVIGAGFIDDRMCETTQDEIDARSS